MEFDEHDPHWAELESGLPIHLAGFPPCERWFPPSPHPVLAINIHNLYEKVA
jgi:hypothetical protein